jgi:transposase-like protein
MRSVLDRGRRRKKARRLEGAEIVDRATYEGMQMDARVSLIQELIPLGLMHVSELLQAEVAALAGDRHARKEAGQPSRHGSNPGSVRLAGQRHRIAVPRVRGDGGELPLRTYEALQEHGGLVDETLLRRVLYGLSCRNYEAAAAAIPGAIGLSSSSVSRAFTEASAKQLRAFQDRELGEEDYVAIFLDGKRFADATMVIAAGITADGRKQFLGFVETDTENAQVLTAFLRSLIARGLDVSAGVLVIVDGAKGLHAAVRKVFARRAVVQRCMWHKRENVVSHLPRGEQASWRRRLQRALSRPTYREASAALQVIHTELEDLNQSAARSLHEGIDELLTLHRLGLFGVLGLSFKTTNCLESINAQIEERCSKIDHWKNSSQRQRWLATALLDIEPRLRRVRGCKHLPKLRRALQRELGLEGPQQKAA